MEGAKVWLKIFGAVVVLVGTIFVYEGRNIIQKHFKNFGDENFAVFGIKAFGSIIAIIGGMLLVL